MLGITRWFVKRDAKASQVHMQMARQASGRLKNYHLEKSLEHKRQYQNDLEYRRFLRAHR